MDTRIGEAGMDDMFTKEQKEDLAYFWDNLDRFVNDPLLRFKQVVIHNKQITGAYDTAEAALSFALNTYPQGQYVIQEVIQDDDVVSFLYPALA
jgi:hypothetical protein